MKTLATTFILAIELAVHVWAQNVPSFKVAAHTRDGVILLVLASATDAELTGW